MDTHDRADDPTDGEARVIGHRARAAAELDQITQKAKRVLQAAGIGFDVFFLIPSSGDAILTFGTTSDPDDQLWLRVAEIVCSIVREAIGLDRTRCREVVCATTHDQA